MSEKTTAEKLHKAYRVIENVEETILSAFEKYEPENKVAFDFHIVADDYDNSIEIYFENLLPYPYEPCKEVRDFVYGLGFSIVFWNFIDEYGNYTDEIRGHEPRHYKDSSLWKIVPGVGYVDDRYKKAA